MFIAADNNTDLKYATNNAGPQDASLISVYV
jgi:hypothetical protein